MFRMVKAEAVIVDDVRIAVRYYELRTGRGIRSRTLSNTRGAAVPLAMPRHVAETLARRREPRQKRNGLGSIHGRYACRG
jgi:hypothetical protein